MQRRTIAARLNSSKKLAFDTTCSSLHWRGRGERRSAEAEQGVSERIKLFFENSTDHVLFPSDFGSSDGYGAEPVLAAGGVPGLGTPYFGAHELMVNTITLNEMMKLDIWLESPCTLQHGVFRFPGHRAKQQCKFVASHRGGQNRGPFWSPLLLFASATWDPMR